MSAVWEMLLVLFSCFRGSLISCSYLHIQDWKTGSSLPVLYTVTLTIQTGWKRECCLSRWRRRHYTSDGSVTTVEELFISTSLTEVPQRLIWFV